MTPTASYRLAELVLGSDLIAFIEERRPEVAWDRIARDLWIATDHEIDVTGPTIKKWHDEHGRAVA